MIFFISHPIQYFSPVLKELALRTKFKVYYFSDSSIKGVKDIGFDKTIIWDIPLLDGYDFEFIYNWRKTRPLSNKFWDVFNPGVIRVLWNSKEKVVVVNGWVYSSHLITIFFAKLFGKKVWLRGDNPLNQELRKNKSLISLKKLLLKPFFYIFIDKFLYVGKQNKLFFNFYGVQEKKLIFVPHAVDNEFFKRKFIEFKDKSESFKKSLNIPFNHKIILFVGKYIWQKNPIDLLKSFINLPSNQFTLIFVGEGPLREEMTNFINYNKISNVILTGFINQSEIAKYYTLADIFIMPSSSETWGLSVNEAMNFNLPIIVSEDCGCSSDLVCNGKNGFTFNTGDCQMLSKKILKIFEDDNKLKSMGKESSEIIKLYSIERISHNIIQAL